MRLNKRTRSILLSGMIGVMTLSTAFPALAATGWTTAGDKQYYYYNDGQMAKGLVTIDNIYYYFNEDGSLWKGWLQIGEDYYYMQSSNGALSTGWVQIGSDWYYMLPESGKCVLNTAMEIEGSWYFFKSDGKRLGGWLKKDDAFYYMDPADSGRMVAGITKNIGGVNYTFAANGVCASAVQVTDYYTAVTASAADTTQNSTQTEDDNYGKTNVIVAGERR